MADKKVLPINNERDLNTSLREVSKAMAQLEQMQGSWVDRVPGLRWLALKYYAWRFERRKVNAIKESKRYGRQPKSIAPGV